MPLEPDWAICDYEIDRKLSQLQAALPLTYGGTSEAIKFSELGSKLIASSKVTPKPLDLTDKFKDATSLELKHKFETRAWEKHLHQIFDESKPDVLVKNAKELLDQYFKSLPNKPDRSLQYSEDESPIDFLHQAILNYATAIKYKPKDPVLHLQLGMALEERYFAEDAYGLIKESESFGKAAGSNVKARESSKSEECDAICKLHGVDPSSDPLSLQLQAIDKEYHSLVASGNSGADHVQSLFAWKSKQAMQEGAAAQKAEDETAPLGQAYLKYMDALSLDDSKAVYHFHVGRLLVIQGDYESAVRRLEAALAWNPQHQMSRFYLGLALALQKDGPGVRMKEALDYLLECLELVLTKRTEQALKPAQTNRTNTLHAEGDVQNNIHFLRGFIALAKIISSNTTQLKDTMSATDIFHTACLLATLQLPTVSRGDMYKQLEWVLLESHACLLQILSANQKGNEKLIVSRCEKLSALIGCCTIPQNSQLLSLQEKTCQQLVSIQPCNSYSLYLLGVAQLTQYENSAPGEMAETFLESCKQSFKVSIDLEGMPSVGEPPQLLKEEKWWQDKVKVEEEKVKAAAKKSEQPAIKTPAGAGRVAAAARGRGAAAGKGAARGAPAVRGSPAARGARGGAAVKPAAVPAKGSAVKPAAKAAAGAKGPAEKATTGRECKPAGGNDKPATPESKAVDSASINQAALMPSNAPLNRKSHHAQLGLARALSKTPDTHPEAQKYYSQVLTMAPEVHDAYIEMAEMLTKSDPMGAVDVYAKFPVVENPSFDDAFIFGEIIRLLMKGEKFDDSRLAPNLIRMGKIMGLAYIEKYVETLDSKMKTDLCKQVYAGVNNKDVNNPDLAAFFKFKCWI